MSDCLFCGIVRGDIPSRKVAEDDDVFAFEDIAPKAPTHILVVPKEHLDDIAHAKDPASLGRLFLSAARIAKERGLDHYRLVVNNGEQAGQSVFHLHVHVLGGRPFAWPPG
ncbi:MAG: histidine triad nucleotide-binding protein [Thermoanaerobaculia bacterium]